MTATLPIPSVVRALGYDSFPQWGPLWRDPAYVMTCLRRYLTDEGHGNAFGLTVSELANRLSDVWHYEATGEEIRAVVCLLQLGQGKAIV